MLELTQDSPLWMFISIRAAVTLPQTVPTEPLNQPDNPTETNVPLMRRRTPTARDC
jgi:hypothetical protein